jgi:hypothetical protein
VWLMSIMASHIELWPLDRLIPYARNPRRHSEAQIAPIAASIRQFDFVNPILVNPKAGMLAGHDRLEDDRFDFTLIGFRARTKATARHNCRHWQLPLRLSRSRPYRVAAGRCSSGRKLWAYPSPQNTLLYTGPLAQPFCGTSSAPSWTRMGGPFRHVHRGTAHRTPAPHNPDRHPPISRCQENGRAV